MKVVLDTNLLISAFITPNGEPAQVVKLLHAEAFYLLLSEDVFTELERAIQYLKLRKLYRYTDEQIEEFLEGIRRVALWVEGTERLVVVQTDESDNRFIELAVAGNARYLMTGDKRHLLKMRRYRPIDIVSPTEFLTLVRTENI
ncbi:putative toxin-antitoxin system toxin component, PIN family [bacterium]|nr:putative toxin-antitoxin system toxin component, PIN family [bacterium]